MDFQQRGEIAVAGKSLRWGSAAAAIAAAAVMLFAASPALGARVAATVDSREVEVKEAEHGWTTEVGITNLADHELDLEVPFYLTKPEGCIPRVQDGKIRVGEHRLVEVKLPPKCEAGDGIVFRISSFTPEGPPFPIEIVAVPGDDEAAPPPWKSLWLFAGLLVLLPVASLLYARRLGKGLGTSLQHLGDTWSFADSWVSNVTVAGGLLTGILGSSDVITAVLGEGAESAVGLATVGAAVSVALLAAAPLVLEATKVTVPEPRENDPGGDHPRLWGFAVASAVALAAAFGQLWVVAISATRLDLGGMEDWLPWLLAALASLLLAAYARRNFRRTIEIGTTKTEDTETAKLGIAAVEAAVARRPAAMP
jgi:hypothetical protein